MGPRKIGRRRPGRRRTARAASAMACLTRSPSGRCVLFTRTRIHGTVVPMLSPLKADEQLDVDAIPGLVDFLIDGGVDALFVLGSAGEGATLRPIVRYALVDAVIAANRGRVPVVAGALEPATARVIDKTFIRSVDGVWTRTWSRLRTTSLAARTTSCTGISHGWQTRRTPRSSCTTSRPSPTP